MSTVVPLFVPQPGGSLEKEIVPGAAIVGSERGIATWHVYPEPDAASASNVVTLADRAHHAAMRLRESTRTAAEPMVHEPDLRRVGTFDLVAGRIALADEDSAAAVAQWLGLGRSRPSSDAVAGELIRSGTRPRQMRVFHTHGFATRLSFAVEPPEQIVEVHAYEDALSGDDESACRLAFWMFNVGDDPGFGGPDPRAADYRSRGNRSLSVGDVVAVGDRFYLCASSSWEEISAPRIVTAGEPGSIPQGM